MASWPAPQSSRISMAAEDGSRYGVDDGEWTRLKSRRGELEGRVVYTERMRPGEVFVPFVKLQEHAANFLTNSAFDPTSKIPEYKVSAVPPSRRSNRESLHGNTEKADDIPEMTTPLSQFPKPGADQFPGQAQAPPRAHLGPPSRIRGGGPAPPWSSTGRRCGTTSANLERALGPDVPRVPRDCVQRRRRGDAVHRAVERRRLPLSFTPCASRRPS